MFVIVGCMGNELFREKQVLESASRYLWTCPDHSAMTMQAHTDRVLATSRASFARCAPFTQILSNIILRYSDGKSLEIPR